MFDNPTQLLSMMKNKDGVKSLLMEENGGFSFADLVADSINIQRMDNKRIAQAVGTDIKIERMTPETAAEILQEGVQGDPSRLVEVFNELEDQRAEILDELIDDEEHDEYREKKKIMLYSQAHGDDELEKEVREAVENADG